MTSWPSKQANCFALEPLSSSAKNSAPDEVHVPALEATLLLQEVQDMLRDAPSSSILFTFLYVFHLFFSFFSHFPEAFRTRLRDTSSNRVRRGGRHATSSASSSFPGASSRRPSHRGAFLPFRPRRFVLVFAPSSSLAMAFLLFIAFTFLAFTELPSTTAASLSASRDAFALGLCDRPRPRALKDTTSSTSGSGREKPRPRPRPRPRFSL